MQKSKQFEAFIPFSDADIEAVKLWAAKYYPRALVKVCDSGRTIFVVNYNSNKQQIIPSIEFDKLGTIINDCIEYRACVSGIPDKDREFKILITQTCNNLKFYTSYLEDFANYLANLTLDLLPRGKQICG